MRGPVLGRDDQLSQLPAHHLGPRPAEGPLGGAVPLDHVAVAADHDHRIQGGVDDGRLQRLALGQSGLRALPVRDVLDYPVDAHRPALGVTGDTRVDAHEPLLVAHPHAADVVVPRALLEARMDRGDHPRAIAGVDHREPGLQARLDLRPEAQQLREALRPPNHTRRRVALPGAEPSDVLHVGDRGAGALQVRAQAFLFGQGLEHEPSTQSIGAPDGALEPEAQAAKPDGRRLSSRSVMMLSTSPYSTAPSALKKRSRSMSSWTCSALCPV